jgi:4-hydroxybenzoate polyprenyltransferase
MGWNYKSEKASWWLFFLFPMIPMICALFVPFIHQNPVLFYILFVVLFVVGFIIVWKRAGEKDKKE